MLAQDKLKVYLSIVLLASDAWLLHGFIPSLLWAVVIAIATWPLRLLVASKTLLGDSGVATAMTSLVAALFFLPVGFALFHAAAEVGNITRWIADVQKTGIAVPEMLHGIPVVGGSAADWWRENLSDPAALSSMIGISYALAAAPHPALLGLATGVLAMIPFAAPIIFGGVSLFLLAQGSVVAAVSVFAFGMLVLFIGDYFVRPKIIGDAVKLPFLWVLFGILGGVEVFGLIGLFVGPALMALVMTMWRDLTEPS